MSSEPHTLQGRTALVTGGAHRIGRAIAMSLGRAGCNVIVHFGSSKTAAVETLSLLQEVGVDAQALQADLRDPSEIAALFAEVEQEVGELDILVNSAATFDDAALGEVTADRFDATMAVNVRAPLLALQHALPLLRRSAESRSTAASVINISDMSGLFPWRGFSHHGASKAALVQLTRSAALELAPSIRVNAVVPGAILPAPGISDDSPEWQGVGERLPMGRPGDPEDVGEAVTFLAQASFVTGEVLFVDGGEHLFGSTKR